MFRKRQTVHASPESIIAIVILNAIMTTIIVKILV